MHSEIISLTEFKSDAAGWIKRLQTQPPVVLTQNGRGTAVVQSYEEYERARAQLALLRRANRAMADARDGRTTAHDRVVQEMRDLLDKRLADNG